MLSVDTTLRTNITDAIKFWERGRIFYNLILSTVVVLHFVSGYPLSKTMVSVNDGLGIFLLTVAANVAYCTAYLVDLFVQASGFRNQWRQHRWVLFVIGSGFAAIITHFIAAGMFPSASNFYTPIH